MIPETHVLPGANSDEWKFSLLQILVFFLQGSFFSDFFFPQGNFFHQVSLGIFVEISFKNFLRCSCYKSPMSEKNSAWLWEDSGNKLFLGFFFTFWSPTHFGPLVWFRWCSFEKKSGGWVFRFNMSSFRVIVTACTIQINCLCIGRYTVRRSSHVNFAGFFFFSQVVCLTQEVNSSLIQGESWPSLHFFRLGKKDTSV